MSYRGSVSTHGIRACYDEGKRVAESLCFDYHRVHGVEIRIARIFIQHLRATHASRRWPRRQQLHRSGPARQTLTLYGDGFQTPSICYVDDLVEELIRLMNGDHPGPINLGPG